MVSKQLESIIAGIPPATVSKENHPENLQLKEDIISRNPDIFSKKKIIKIVAEVPLSVKDELQHRAKLSGETEKTILLKALKLYGFNINDTMLVDQRSLRK
jgi:hypothetical protein